MEFLLVRNNICSTFNCNINNLCKFGWCPRWETKKIIDDSVRIKKPNTEFEYLKKYKDNINISQ